MWEVKTRIKNDKLALTESANHFIEKGRSKKCRFLHGVMISDVCLTSEA